MAVPIMGGKDIGLWLGNTPKNAGLLVKKMKQVLFDIATKSYF